MTKVIKERCKNGNLYLYFHTGKIKVIKQDGTILWYSKNIFFKKKKKK